MLYVMVHLDLRIKVISFSTQICTWRISYTPTPTPIPGERCYVKYNSDVVGVRSEASIIGNPIFCLSIPTRIGALCDLQRIEKRANVYMGIRWYY